jgi:predicted nuclease of restriction endonuclease-like (RecB) superfamily
MSDVSDTQEQLLYDRVSAILDRTRSHVARTVNTAMVQAYWLVGREIVVVEQRGEARAEYGRQLVEALAARLTSRFGKSFGVATLRRMRAFYLAYPKGSAIQQVTGAHAIRSTPLIESAGEIRSTPLTELDEPQATFPPILSWSHYLTLLRVQNEQARAFYEIEAAREAWSVRELERQIAVLLFDRLAASRSPDEVRALARQGQQISSSDDVIKDPFVLEFLDLKETPTSHERDLEQAIIDRLEEFLLEMGKGFCFVARQKRVTLEGDHFYVDLVFYNRLLRCFVLVDLKLGKLTHQDLGQIQMYVNYFDRFQRAEHEAPTIGIVLCSEKNDAMVKITLPENNEQILAARYQMYLPTEEELRIELARERDEAERVLAVNADGNGDDD